MKKLLLLLLCVPLIGVTQNIEWTKSFGGFQNSNDDADTAYCVQQTLDSGYVIIGDYYSNPNPQEKGAWILKTDQNGNIQWDYKINISTSQSLINGMTHSGFFIQQTSDLGYIVTGRVIDTLIGGYFYPYLLKLDFNGNLEWEKRYTNILAYAGTCIQETHDNGFIIRAETWGWTGGNDYLIKTDSLGNQQWNSSFDPYDHGNSILTSSIFQTSDLGYVFLTHKNSWTTNDSLNLIKTDSNGNEQWNKKLVYDTVASNGYYFNQNMQKSYDGGYIISSKVQLYFNPGGEIFTWLIKIDSNGNKLWDRKLFLNYSLDIISIQETSDYGYIMTGYTPQSSQQPSNLILIKTDSIGVIQWQQQLSSTSIKTKGYDVKETFDGGYIVLGKEWGLSTGSSFLLVKYQDNYSAIYGCTDSLACNYDSLSTVNDSSCVYSVIWQQAFSICNGDSVVVGSSVYNTAGIYTDTLNASNGCDSIVYTNVSISSIIWNQTFLICNGDSIVVGSSVYDTAGAYIDTLNASNGCDSIVHTYIGMAPPIIWQQAFSICDGDSVVVGSSVYDTTGYYTDTLNASNGCDTIMYTNIFLVYQNTSSYDTLSVTFSIVWNGIPLSVSGDYSITLINAVGCDSIVNLNLTITNSTSVEENTNNKELIQITNVLGQETPYRKLIPLFYIYSDGTVEKRIIVE